MIEVVVLPEMDDGAISSSCFSSLSLCVHPRIRWSHTYSNICPSRCQISKYCTTNCTGTAWVVGTLDLVSDPLNLDANKSLWARYAEGTAGNQPAKFLAHALDLVGDIGKADRLAIDLGCGAGNETMALIDLGWKVHAVDSEPHAIEILLSRVTADDHSRLTTQIGDFENVDLPEADLVFASLSLPFAADRQEAAIQHALEAVKPAGWFVGVLLGHNDTWASTADVATVDRQQIDFLFARFGPTQINEEEFDGPSGSGDKHWHWYIVSTQRPGL